MRIAKHDKTLLFEQEFVALICIAVLGFVFHTYQKENLFYFITLAVGFIFYFWMMEEEKIHKTGKKHEYFEHTSSYIMIAQTALALMLTSSVLVWPFWMMIAMIVSVIMYSVALSRIILYKIVFKADQKE